MPPRARRRRTWRATGPFPREGAGQKQQALICFSKARATSALVFALAADDTQLYEAIYESISALDEPAELVRMVEHALG